MKKLKLLLLVLGASLVLSLAIFGLGIFDRWELKATDFYYQTVDRASGDIVLVTIDDETLEKMERRWQDITRADMAEVIDQVMKDGASIMGIDVNFADESEEAYDGALEKVLSSHKNIVLVNEYIASDGDFISPLERFQEHVSMGFANVKLDLDGVVRSIKVEQKVGDKRTLSFATEIMRVFLGQRPRDVELVDVDGQANFVLSKRNLRPPSKPDQKIAPLSMPLTEDGTFLVNYFGKPYTFKSVPFYKVHRGQFDKGVFKDKIVLLGATTFTLHDEYLTPVSVNGIGMPGVEIHANTLQTIMSRSFLEMPPVKNKILMLAVIVILISFVWVFIRMRWAFVITGLLFASYLITAWAYFALGTILPVLYPAVAFLFTTIVALSLRYYFESREKRFIKQTFSRYVSETVVDKIIENPQLAGLGGKRKNLTVMFSDLGNFTSFSEKLSPEKLVDFMNRYLSAMTDLILEEEGTLDKYEGDAIMAFWGAPLKMEDDAVRACRSALSQVAAFNEMGKKWGKRASGISLRIGLHKGEMIVGNMGSEKRFDYTVMGDNVNLSARLEGVNKVYGTAVCVSEEIYKKAKASTLDNGFLFRELDLIRVKGRKAPVRIYELLEEGEDNSWAQKFAEALELYRAKNWDEATAMFKEVEELRGGDRVSAVFIERIKRYMDKDADQLSEDWDGVFDMTSK